MTDDTDPIAQAAQQATEASEGDETTTDTQGKAQSKGYKTPWDFEGAKVASKVNGFVDRFDPDETAASSLMLGESCCAFLDAYGDAPDKLNIHPAWWLLGSGLGVGLTIMYRVKVRPVLDGEKSPHEQGPPQGSQQPPQEASSLAGLPE